VEVGIEKSIEKGGFILDGTGSRENTHRGNRQSGILSGRVFHWAIRKILERGARGKLKEGGVQGKKKAKLQRGIILYRGEGGWGGVGGLGGGVGLCGGVGRKGRPGEKKRSNVET